MDTLSFLLETANALNTYKRNGRANTLRNIAYSLPKEIAQKELDSIQNYTDKSQEEVET